MKVDPEKLPGRACVDTSVLTYALGNPKNVDAAVKEATVAFFEGMQAPGHRILIAAPSLAEMLRADPSFKAPRTHDIEVVHFDDAAAETLARHFPTAVLQDARAALGGVTAGYIKFDAQIVA